MKPGFNVETGKPEKDTILKSIGKLLLVGAVISLLTLAVRQINDR